MSQSAEERGAGGGGGGGGRRQRRRKKYPVGTQQRKVTIGKALFYDYV